MRSSFLNQNDVSDLDVSINFNDDSSNSSLRSSSSSSSLSFDNEILHKNIFKNDTLAKLRRKREQCSYFDDFSFNQSENKLLSSKKFFDKNLWSRSLVSIGSRFQSIKNNLNEINNNKNNKERRGSILVNLFSKIQDKKLKNSNSINNGCVNLKKKHVIFSDTLGLDLELIHTVKMTNIDDINCINKGLLDFTKIISKQSFFDSYNHILRYSSMQITNENSSKNHKTIIPKFSLSPDKNYEKLVKNGICLNSIEIYDQTSIRGIILTLTKSHSNQASNDINTNEISIKNDPKIAYKEYIYEKVTSKFRSMILGQQQQSNRHHDQKKNILDLVYIIWSIDDFKTWKYQASVQNNCKEISANNGIIKTNEFFIQNLDDKLIIGQKLKLIVCHQIGLTVYRDTNNELCYNFECAFKF